MAISALCVPWRNEERWWWWLSKVLFPWQIALFLSPPTWFQYVSDSKGIKQGHKLKLTYYMFAGSCISGTICKYENGAPKVARNAFNIGRSGTQYVAMATTARLVLWSTFSRILLQRIKHFWYWLRHLFSSCLMKIWSSVWCHHFANLYILRGEKLNYKSVAKEISKPPFFGSWSPVGTESLPCLFDSRFL